MPVRGQGTIPDDWSGDYCRYAICWPKSPQWEAILRGVLTLPATGRFWDEHTGVITEAQSVMKETFDYNLHLKGVIMACDDPGLSEIAAAIRLVATSMQSGAGDGCCEKPASAGGGQTEPALDTTLEGNPTTDPPPQGFETWEEFYNDKCATAQDIVDQLVFSLGRIALQNFGVMTIDAISVSLAILITLTISAEIIIALAALLIAIAAEIVITTLISIINDNEADLVCQLYKGESADGSFTLFHSALGDYVDNVIADPVEGFAAKAIARYMVNHQVVNRLYTKDLTRIWPASDCTSCNEGCLDCIARVDSIEGWLADLQVPTDFFQMQSATNLEYKAIIMKAVGPDVYRIEFQDIQQWVLYPPVAGQSFVLRDENEVILYAGDDFEAFAAASAVASISASSLYNWQLIGQQGFQVFAKMSYAF